LAGAPPPKPPLKQPLASPGKNPGVRHWLRELWLVARNTVLFVLGAIGFLVLVKYFGKALVFALPLFVLFFGVSLYSWLRARDRRKKPPK
jgi:hypothetical protein